MEAVLHAAQQGHEVHQRAVSMSLERGEETQRTERGLHHNVWGGDPCRHHTTIIRQYQQVALLYKKNCYFSLTENGSSVVLWKGLYYCFTTCVLVEKD